MVIEEVCCTASETVIDEPLIDLTLYDVGNEVPESYSEDISTMSPTDPVYGLVRVMVRWADVGARNGNGEDVPVDTKAKNRLGSLRSVPLG